MPEKQEKLKFKKVSEKKQQVVYDVARKFGGETTITDIYANSNLAINEIEEVLAELNSRDYIKTDFNEQTSIIKYIFPDIKKDYFKEKRSLGEKVGLNKLVLRLKYGNLKNNVVSDLERAILQTAQEFSGRLTMAKIVEYTGLSVADAESVLWGLSAKGICNKELKADFINIEYTFPEIIETSATKKQETEEEYSTLLNMPKTYSKKLLNNFRIGTDKFIIKGKVNRFRRRAKQNLALDTIAPGFGHLMDKRWGMAELLLFSFLPMLLTAGLSYFPAMMITRYQTLKYYSITEKDLNKNLRRLNKNSLIYSIVLLIIYITNVGMHGVISYYSHLFKMFGF